MLKEQLLLAFPHGCVQYAGPHRLECLITIWKDAGCVVQGWSFPGNLTRRQLVTYEDMDIKY